MQLTSEIKRSLWETVQWSLEHGFGAEIVDFDELRMRKRYLGDANRFFESRNFEQGRESLLKADPESLRPLGVNVRSTALKPGVSLLDARSEHEREQLVKEVVGKRAALTGPLAEWPATDDFNLAGGRVLLYFPTESLSDGAAQYLSNGFFDGNNEPPWDIWLGYSQGTLISWVPPAFISLAQAGIDANPENCISWAL